MKNPYALVKFDDGVTKVARCDLIREVGTKKQYSPKSTLDLPTHPVEVKWQKSVVGSDLSHDGFYPATVLVVRSSLDAVLEQAKEMLIRLPPCPVIALPARSMLDVEEPSKLGKRPRAAERSNETANSSSTSKAVKKVRKEVDVSLEDNDAIDVDKFFLENDSKDKRKKVNKAAKDPVTRERVNKVFKQSLEFNPLMKAAHSKKVTDSPKPLRKSNQSPLKAVNDAVFTCSPTKLKLQSPLNNLCQSTSPFIVTPKICSTEVPCVHIGSAKKKLFSEEVDSKLNNCSKLKVSSQECESVKEHNAARQRNESAKVPSSKSQALDDGREKSVKNLKQKPRSMKFDSSDESDKSDSSGEGESSSAIGNNGGSDNDLESTLPVSPRSIKDDPCTESERSFASSDDDDSVGKLLDDNKRLVEQLNGTNKKLAELERQMTLANNLRLKHKESVTKLEAENSELKKKLSSVESQVQLLRKRNEYLQDKLLECDSKNSKSKSIPVMELFGVEDGLKSNRVVEVSCGDQSKAVHEDKKVKSKEALNKKENKKDHNVDLNDAALEATCTKVLDHLSGTAALEEDSKGRINIGNGVVVQKKAFFKNFTDHKIDLRKIARNLTSMVWTRSERCERSLEGDQSKRFADAERKRPAEAEKVATVLGAIKAHMLHSGDAEGPSMSSAIMMCRKAIGVKFAQDSYNVKRNNQ